MFAIGIALLAIGGIGTIICWVMVLIKMFKNEKPLLGVLGIFCGLWAFIWGWMKSKTLGLKQTMMIWSVCWLLSMVGYGLFVAGAIAKAESGEFEMSPPAQSY